MGGRGKSKKVTLKQRRLSNKFSIKATDNALKGGLGIGGLSIFWARHAVGRHAPHQKRYYTSIAALLERLQAGARGRSRRS